MSNAAEIQSEALAVRVEAEAAWRDGPRKPEDDDVSAEAYTYSGDAMQHAERAEWAQATGQRALARAEEKRALAALALADEARGWLVARC